MRLVAQYDTPWAVYAAAFSSDGTRLAIGGGTWYGFGGIALIDLATSEIAFARLGDITERGGSVSALAFAADDRHLMATTWTASQNRGPTLVFEVDRLALKLAHTRQPHGDGTTTGLVSFGPTAVVRQHRATLQETLLVRQWPRELLIDAGRPRQHLTNNRLVIANGHAITSDHGIAGTQAFGLVVRPLGGPGGATHIAARNVERVTAIGITADGTIITGGRDGELDRWNWSSSLPRQEARIATIPQPIVPRSGTWVTYRPSSVVGICSIVDGTHLAITAGGMLASWRGVSELACWELPVSGSPRTIAAHPDRGIVAIGIKTGGFSAPESKVAIVEIAPDTIDPAWITPRVTDMARAVDGVAYDPTSFGVLADALEEAGAPPAVFGHLRSHDHRVPACWVVDRVLGR